MCQTGGHLGPNLGVIELTLAVHRVFDSPGDPIIFDTGHQSYVHKILTGRQDQFRTLRQRHGCPATPVRRSPSTTGWRTHALNRALLRRWAGQGHSAAAEAGHCGRLRRDGSLTGGMAWEALNNIAASDDLPLVIVVNDNGRSYTPTVGGVARR